jgi:lipopolysaccharide biosynthesis glycosyltransferase
MEIIKLVVGFDQVEAVAYHTFCQSIIDRSTLPVQFLPLAVNTLPDYTERHTDCSNQFVYSRFLTPYLNNFEGWAIFADGDMVCLADIAELWALRDASKAVQVVKHDYITKVQRKYLGSVNENYPRKNWSSLVLWNCGHPANRVLTPELVEKSTGSFLHRFSWLDDNDIGDLPSKWNWLAIEYPPNQNVKLVHYTLGTPCFEDYRDTDMSEHWHEAHKRALSPNGTELE